MTVDSSSDFYKTEQKKKNKKKINENKKNLRYIDINIQEKISKSETTC